MLLKPFWLKRGMTSDYCPTSAPASQEEGVDDDGIIPVFVASPPIEPPPTPVGPRRRGLGSVPQREAFYGWIVGDPSMPDPATAADVRLPAHTDPAVFGVAKFEWQFVRASPEADMASEALKPMLVGRQSRAQRPWGYVEYRVIDAWPLAVQMPVPRDLDLGTERAPRDLRLLCSDVRLTQGFASVRDLCLRGPGSSADSVLSLPYSVAVAACTSDPNHLVRSVPLLLRSAAPLDLVLAHPRASSVVRWKRDLEVRRLSQLPAMAVDSGDRWTDVASQLPTPKKPTTQGRWCRRCRGGARVGTH